MKNIVKKLSVILALMLILPVSLFGLSACSKEPNDPVNPDVPPAGEVVDENPNSPIKSGIYLYAKDATLANMFFLDDASMACEHFQTRDVNGVRGILSNPVNEEKYGFQAFVDSITKQDNIQKCVEFNTQNQVSTYLMKDGFFTRIDKFSYTNNEFLFTVSDPNAPFIQYNDITDTVSLIYKFFYTNEQGEKVFPHVYVKVDMAYECDSLDMMTASKGMTEFEFKANSAKVVDLEGTELNSEDYKAQLIEKFNLEAETTTAMEDAVELISGYKVNVGSDLLAVLIKENEDVFKFSFNSVSNNIMVVGGIAIAVQTSITNIESVSEIKLSIGLTETVKLEFSIVKSV